MKKKRRVIKIPHFILVYLSTTFFSLMQFDTRVCYHHIISVPKDNLGRKKCG